jgi:choice-of-anchor A domain-containing protein
LSAALSLVSTTAGSSLSGGTFTAGAATVHGTSNVAVLNITSTQLQAIGNPTVNLGSASIFIINVDTTGTSGSYTAGNGVNFNGAGYAANVLWNFYNASSIAVNVEFGGQVLAPNAAVTNSSPIDGALVAKSFNGTGELHYRPLAAGGISLVNSYTTSVPEPASGLLLGGAVAGLLLRRRR